jgi:hypothetical protein
MAALGEGNLYQHKITEIPLKHVWRRTSTLEGLMDFASMINGLVSVRH